jgi:hypothetical protein
MTRKRRLALHQHHSKTKNPPEKPTGLNDVRIGFAPRLSKLERYDFRWHHLSTPSPCGQSNRIGLKDLISHNFAALRRASFSRDSSAKLRLQIELTF